MRRTAWMFTIFGLLIGVAATAQTAPSQQPKLSPAESAIVARQIATLRNPGEHRMAQGWSDAKKMAEMICRPAALVVLKKHEAGVDKVFLGMDTLESLTLESNARLTGIGEYRTLYGWQNISFVCEVNPATGNVTSFHSTPLPPQP